MPECDACVDTHLACASGRYRPQRFVGAGQPGGSSEYVSAPSPFLVHAPAILLPAACVVRPPWLRLTVGPLICCASPWTHSIHLDCALLQNAYLNTLGFVDASFELAYRELERIPGFVNNTLFVILCE